MKRVYSRGNAGLCQASWSSWCVLSAITASAQTPSIEGTYQLVSRKLPDGTTLKPPDIMGLWTYTKTHRNFNIVRKDATGKFSSQLLRVYLQADAHRVQRDRPLQYRQRPDRWEGHCLRPLRKTRSVPVTVEGGRIEFKPPLAPLALGAL